MKRRGFFAIIFAALLAPFLPKPKPLYTHTFSFSYPDERFIVGVDHAAEGGTAVVRYVARIKTDHGWTEWLAEPINDSEFELKQKLMEYTVVRGDHGFATEIHAKKKSA